MRNLLFFMFLVGVFMYSRNGNGCNCSIGGVKGTGPVKTESRDLSSFNAISVDCSGNVEIVASETFRVEITAQENILRLLKSEIKNNNLNLDFERNVYTSEDVKIKIFVPNLEEISLGGSANINANLPLNGDKLELTISGSGSITVGNADFKKVNCSVGGSGNIEVSGKTDIVEASISGSGGVNAQNLAAREGETSVSGSGSVSCNVEQKLDASISGSGEVKYKGSPTVESSISGSGGISKI
jgi:Putative auto-transporter adhesin, head GIN domain